MGTALLTEENIKFSKIFQGETTRSSFFRGEASEKSIGDDMRIQRGELANTRLTRKYRDG